MRAVLAEYLRNALAAEVVVAANPLQVRVAARSGPFDVVLMDISMDGATPGEMAGYVRENPVNRQTPFIVMSAYSPRDLARSPHAFARLILHRMVALRPVAYIVKPFLLEQLADAIRAARSGATPWKPDPSWGGRLGSVGAGDPVRRWDGAGP